MPRYLLISLNLHSINRYDNGRSLTPSFGAPLRQEHALLDTRESYHSLKLVHVALCFFQKDFLTSPAPGWMTDLLSKPGRVTRCKVIRELVCNGSLGNSSPSPAKMDFNF